MPMKRFAVAEDSMRPTLTPGQEFVASNRLAPRVGDVVAFEHPGRRDFWLVKRRSKAPFTLDRGEIWVGSDNTEANTVDSESLGPIPLAGVFTRVTRLDGPLFGEAVDLLAAEDVALGTIVEQHGLPDFWHRDARFEVLVLLILEQQVSLESGAAMYRRLTELCGEITPKAILAAGESMRDVGVTRQKTGYLIGLAQAIVDGTLDLDFVSEADPDEARVQLTALKGIGNWTADAYLLSAVRHIDMWPVGDRALQVGAGEVLGMTQPPTEDELEILAEPWRPLRAVAARLIWHNYLTVRGREEPPDPTKI